MNYAPIEDHGIIGNQETAALVCKDGAIDFMCFPHFDSPTIFASLLDAKNGGFFQITPRGDFHRHQSYLPNTNILETIFRARHATVIVTDFMTAGSSRHRRQGLIRGVKVIRGEAMFCAVCAPRFGYGQVPHTIRKKAGGILFIPKKKTLPPMLLRTSTTFEQKDGEAQSFFRLRAGDSAWFILEEFSADTAPVRHAMIQEALEQTSRYWQNWVAQSKYRGRWREMVQRSALTLALLISKKEGSIVAAPTFGLPERVVGDRNWDYRFSWIRDASFALDAFLKLGYTDEAHGLMGWLEGRCREAISDKPLQVVYRLTGSRRLAEHTLDDLEGYKGSRPIRIGNAAYNQLQLDIYGEFIDSVFLFDRYDKPVALEFWRDIRRLVDWICNNWMRADDGIWEVRDGARPFFYSRAMCWLAVDRALKLARRRSFSAPFGRWKAVCKRIYGTVRSFWNQELRSFVQYEGSQLPDASLLLLPRVDFISPADPRWQLTLRAIESHLVEDCFVHRCLSSSTPKNRNIEGTFSACSFWYVEALARGNGLLMARAVFEKFLGYANHLGLYSEQLGPQSQHWGNFPQALSHISLIRAACDLDERLSKVE
jgi:GH15 family glucan-1,4-alpha-glucosidase